jgi:iron complex transport system ATP-binding protein
MITIEHVEIGYAKKLFVADNLTFLAGQVYALIGRNGTGKSTFLKTLSGEIPCLKGKILLQGKDVRQLTAHEKSKQIAVVESKFEGISFLTVQEYIALGRAPYTDLFGRMSDEDLTIVKDISKELKLEHLLDKDTVSISDGERQMAMIARALAQETPLILLDEPSAFLDFVNRQLLIENLIAIARKMNKCIILSTHDLEVCTEENLPLILIHQQHTQISQGLTKQEVKDKLSQ